MVYRVAQEFHISDVTEIYAWPNHKFQRWVTFFKIQDEQNQKAMSKSRPRVRRGGRTR